MNGFRFYAEVGAGTLGDDGKPILPQRATRRAIRDFASSCGKLNCVAVMLGAEHRCPDGAQEALSSVFFHADSDVNLGSAGHGYLRQCRRIDEATARRLHPRLFQRLDMED